MDQESRTAQSAGQEKGQPAVFEIFGSETETVKQREQGREERGARLASLPACVTRKRVPVASVSEQEWWETLMGQEMSSDILW